MASPAPLLSVTVSNYNYGRYLGECIESILSQSFEDFELIVIDDCSTDGSLDVVRPYLSDGRVKLVAHEQNQGFTKTLIEGTEVHSRGEYLSIISADDIVKDQLAFEQQLGLMRSTEVAVFCFTACTRLQPDGTETLHQPFARDMAFEPAEALRLFLDGCYALQSGTICHAPAYYATGGYRRDIAQPLDLAFYLAICMEGRTVYNAAPLYTYRLHEGQMSSTRMDLNNREIVTVIEDACAAGETRGLIEHGWRDKAIRRQMRGAILNDALYGRRREVVERVTSWLRLEPLNTLRNDAFWLAALRLVAGRRSLDLVRSGGTRLGMKTGTERLRESVKAAR